MKGVPFARAPAAARSIPGRTSGSAISIGSMNDMASVEPGASAATCRSVAAIASLVRYMLTPVDATTAGRAGVEARRRQPLPPRVARLEVDRHEPQERRDAEAELDEALALPGLRAGLIDLEHQQAGGELRPALGEGVEARAEDDVLPDAAGGLFGDEIFDEAGARHDGGAEGPRERAHVRAAAPSVVRRRQLQADLVFEHVRRRIDLHVQRPPQGDPHRGVLWAGYHLIILP